MGSTMLAPNMWHIASQGHPELPLPLRSLSIHQSGMAQPPHKMARSPSHPGNADIGLQRVACH